MYICPTCCKEFEKEEVLVKHFLNCWKEQHPYHQSVPAPRTEDITTREVNDNVLSFFANMKESQ